MAPLLARGTKHPRPGNVGMMVSILENSGSAGTEQTHVKVRHMSITKINQLYVHAVRSQYSTTEASRSYIKSKRTGRN